MDMGGTQSHTTFTIVTTGLILIDLKEVCFRYMQSGDVNKSFTHQIIIMATHTKKNLQLKWCILRVLRHLYNLKSEKSDNNDLYEVYNCIGMLL